MKKIFTLIAMAAMALGASAQDWNASNAEALANGTKILDNDYVKINTAVQDTEAALIKDENDNPDPKTFGGFTFTKYVNIRVDAGPAESNNWEGTAYGDATPSGISLIVKAKKNTDVTLYYKHGNGKVLSCYDQTAKGEVAITETAAQGVDSYYTGVFKFISGHTYTIYARGGTTGLSGIKTDEGTYVEPATAVYAYNSDANLVTYADGATMQITGNTEKNFGGGANITISGATYKGIKNSNGAQMTFTAPAGKKIYLINFYAIPNKDGEAPNFKEFNGVTLAEPIAITTTKDGTNPTKITMCANGVEAATFTFAGKQVNFAIEVDYSESAYDAQYDPSATTGIQTVKAENAANAVIYNLAGQKVSENYKGVVIMNGRKVMVK